jgi:hypothetical protein
MVMARLFFMLTIVLCFASCGGGGQKNATADKPVSDLTKEGIFGQVDSIRQRVYWCVEKFKRLEKGKLQNMVAQDFLKVYNKAGFLVEQTNYNVKDEIVSIRKITYNDKHLPIKEELFKGTELDEYIEYTYNDKNKISKMEKFDKSGAARERTEYTYYKDSNLLMDEDQYNREGNLSVKFVRVYNGVKLIERQKYWGGGSPAQTEYYEYDNLGRLTSSHSDVYKDKVATFEKRTIYSYEDSSANYTERVEYKQNERPVQNTRLFDEFGNVTESIFWTESVFFPASRMVSEKVAVEDADEEEGDEETVEVAEVEVEYAPDEIAWIFQSGDAFTYKYDDKNNWSQKITYKCTDDRDTKTRQFYYERIVSYR